MPAKNSIKQYLENGYYHIYNRGVEKRIIFIDQQDYNVFLSYLKEYLLPKDEEGLFRKLSDPATTLTERKKIYKMIRMNNFSEEITLLAFCLMPNHFHFFIKQKSKGSIDRLMNSLGTRYTMYFNKKYDRVGSLYQGVYKAVSIIREPQFIYLSKYIHKQALSFQGLALKRALPSSYGEYVGERKTKWVNPEEILSYFSKNNPGNSYKNFVLENVSEDEVIILENVMFEE